MDRIAEERIDSKTVLGKALINAADQLGLKQAQLALVIGVDNTAISGLKTHPELDPATKQGELALLLIRIYHAVYALTGGDPEWMQYFMHSYNEATKGIPIEQIQTISGLVTVLHFVDAI